MPRLVQQAWLFVVIGATSAWAAPNPYLSQAKVFHQGLEFEKCLKRLDQAGNWKANTERELAEIELFQGLCQLGLGKEKDAGAHFEMALRIDRALELPPLQSPRVVALFKKVKDRLGAAEPEPAKAPEPVKEPVKAPEPVKEPVKPPEAVKAPEPVKPAEPSPALVPQPKPAEPTPALTEPAPKSSARLVAPLVFGGLAVAAAITATILGVSALGTAAKVNTEQGFQDDKLKLIQQARAEAMGTNVAWIAAGGSAVVGVVLLLVLK